MKTSTKIIITLACIAAAALCVLPVMNVYVSEGESGLISVSGYNLMEFSAWACVSVLAPLAVPVVVLGSGSRAAKNAALGLLFMGSTVCYVHSFNAAREWLMSLGGGLVRYYPGAFAMPLGLAVVLALAAALEILSHKKIVLIKEKENV